MDLKHIAMFAWLPFLTADLGGLAGGYVSPLIARVTNSPLIRARVIGVSLAAVLMIGPGCIGLVASPYAALALLCVGGFAHQTLSVLINTFTADCYPSARVGTANGFVSQAGWFGGLLFSLAIGQLADKVGFTPLFGALGVFDLVGALVLWLGLRHLLRAAGDLAQ
jgi:ACS family hexuronate transporter-like MFS transporter